MIPLAINFIAATVDSSFLASALATFAHDDDVDGVCALLTSVYHYDMEGGDSGGLAVDDVNEYLHCCLTVSEFYLPLHFKNESC